MQSSMQHDSATSFTISSRHGVLVYSLVERGTNNTYIRWYLVDLWYPQSCKDHRNIDFNLYKLVGRQCTWQNESFLRSKWHWEFQYKISYNFDIRYNFWYASDFHHGFLSYMLDISRPHERVPFICNASSPSDSHPARYMVDGQSVTHWQAKAAVDVVNITIDLRSPAQKVLACLN